MPLIKNQKDLEKMLNSYLEKALVQTQKIIYKTIDASINEYYSEYEPSLYKRSYKFLESLVQTDIIRKENLFTCEVKIDEDYLTYKYPNTYLPNRTINIPATGLDVATWANRDESAAGNHGYTVDAGREEGFWDIAIDELGDIPGLIKLFKENLIKAGLPVK